MEFLDSNQAVDVDRDHTHLGEVVWGIRLKDEGRASRMLGLCWEWREVMPNVLALSNPLGIQSNVLLKDERGELLARSKLVLHLNAAVSGFRWQTPLIRRTGTRRYMAA
jgi:hypothetical protein